MRIGMILECGPQGADVEVHHALAKKLDPTISISTVTLDNKPNLVAECGKSASQLLSIDRCDRVLIIWDLYPAWERQARPCRCEDREDILASLNRANIDLARVHLVCITQELETWLLADGRALSAFLSTPEHRVRVSHPRLPEQINKPKRALSRIFRQHGKDSYYDLFHASKIVAKLPDLTRIRRISSFQRFQQKIT